MKFWSKMNPLKPHFVSLNYHIWIRIVLIVVMLSVATLPLMLRAQTNPQNELNKTATAAGISSQTDLAVIVGRIVSILIGFLGLIAVIIILIGGFQWMTSGGDSEKIKSARDLMINGMIGLVIIVLAYAIATFVITRLNIIAAPGSSGNLP